MAKVGLALIGLVAAGCSSSSGGGSPAVVRITDPAVAKSRTQSQFITDLYSSGHADYWRSIGQARLVAIAGIYCVETGSRAARSDLAGDFKGLSSDGLDEFIGITSKDICGPMSRHGGKLP